MTVWIPPWLLQVGACVGVIVAWELIKAGYRFYRDLGEKMGWPNW